MFETLSEHRCHGGTVGFYRHPSTVIGLPMKFGMFVPDTEKPAPLLTFLAGLTCTEETFLIKAGALRHAAEHGLALLAPDTSPRGANVPGEADAWDFGVGAGFYLDATEAPWAAHWRMESYLTDELLPLAGERFAIDGKRLGISGHSMGGHGALTLAMRHPGRFRSVSAFAPICSPHQVPWGEKAFSNYLGPDRDEWRSHDAVALLQDAGKALLSPFLVDQGLADKFLHDQLKPELLEAACAEVGQGLILRRHDGYDHSYWFIQSFIADHIRHHADALKN